MHFSGGGGGGRRNPGSSSSSSSSDRAALLLASRVEREAREHARGAALAGGRVLAFIRMAAARRRLARTLRADLASKLADVDKVAAVMQKLRAFLPPAAALQQLLAAALLSDRASRLEIDLFSLRGDRAGAAAVADVARLLGWCARSLALAPSGASQLAMRTGATFQLVRAVRLACRLLFAPGSDAANAGALRTQFLDFILAACGGGLAVPSLTSFPSASPLASSLASADVCRSLHAFTRRSLRFAETVARRALWLCGSTEGASFAVASRTVEISAFLAESAPLADQGSELRTLWGALLTVPWGCSRLHGSAALNRLAAPALLQLLLRAQAASIGPLTGPAQGQPPPLPLPRRRHPLAIAAATALIPAAAASAATESSASLRTLMLPGSASLALASSSAAETVFSSSASAFTASAGLYAAPTKSFFDSALARGSSGVAAAAAAAAVAFVASSAPSTSSASATPAVAFGGSDSRTVEAWPASAYLLGNLLVLLTPISEAQGLAALDADAATLAVRVLAELVEALPEEVWSSARPVIWVMALPSSPTSSSSSAALVPVPMPPQLAQQLRRLSSERLARAAARLLTAMRPEALQTARLRLADDADPERGSYDASFVGLELDSRLSAAGRVAGRSALDAAPSAAGTMLRGLWEGSKLAASFLRRQISRGLAPASSTVASATAAQPSPEVVAAQKVAAAARSAAAVAAATGLKMPSSPSASAGPSLFSAAQATAFDDEGMWAFVRLYANLVAFRPQASAAFAGGGDEAIVGRMQLLNALAFSPELECPRRLWFFLIERCDLRAFVRAQAYRACARHDGAFGALALLAALIGHILLVLDDFELHQRGIPLPLRELRHAARLLRDVVAHAQGIGVDSWSAPGAAHELLAAPPSRFYARFEGAAAAALRALYDRHSQRPLGPSDVFVVDVDKCSLCMLVAPRPAPGEPAATAGAALVTLTGAEAREEALQRLLWLMPQAVPFSERAERFDKVRAEHRRRSQEAQPQVRVVVQRARLFDTAHAALKDVRGDVLRRKVHVTFINDEGLPEAGIDAGGLFKELWTSLAALVFDPRFGLWAVTEGGELYPNPASGLCTGFDDTQTFELLGRVLGKALYEGVTVGPQFARFFLHVISGRAVTLHNLPSLDSELYKSLMFLKTYDGNVENDLCLSFSTSSELGGSGGGDEHELVPGGAKIAVTSANRNHYIALLADWRLSGAIRKQTAAFLAGLRDVLPAEWLRPFSAPELQVLISGSLAGVDVADMRAHAQYVGGYFGADRCIQSFWAVVEGMSPRDRAALLRFTTSCERPPPLGFRQLEPRFTVQRVAIRSDSEALPSSSTCFHILKLPTYSSTAVMREKLLLAIHSGAGFEMT